MEGETTRYQFDTLEVHPAAFTVFRDGKALDLEPKAVRVLLHLIEHRHRAVTKEELFLSVWPDTAVTDNALTRIIAQIRRELGDDARQARYVQTLPTTGYRFIADVKVVVDKKNGFASSAPETETEIVVATAPRHKVKLVWIGAMAALLLLAYFGWRRLIAEPSVQKSIQMTTSASLDISPSFSPDGNSFVYSSNRTGSFQLYVRAVSGLGGDRQLTHDSNQNIGPSWSPDGKLVAYHSVAQGGIWVVTIDGGTPRRYTQFGSAPAWSPDGRRIAFRSAEPISLAWFDASGLSESTIWTIASDGSQLRQVTTQNNPQGLHAMPSWSADGKSIVFTALSPLSAVYRVWPETGRQERLLQVGNEVPKQPGSWLTRLWDAKLGPDGEGLFFTAATGRGDYAVFYQSRRGGTPREVYGSGATVASGVTLSRDGKRMLLTQLASDSRLMSLEPGGEARPVFAESVLRAYLPSFSPDGKLISMMVEVAGRNRDIWMMNADGTGASRVSEDAGAKEGGVIWSIKAPGLLYNYIDDKRLEFRRYDPTTKKTAVLAVSEVNQDVFHPAMLPDETEIISACSKPFNICVGPVGGGTQRQLTFERTGALYPNVSRDGRWIAYNLRRGADTQIGLLDRKTGNNQMLTSDRGHNWAFSFSGDNQRIAYAGYHDGVWNLYWVDRTTLEQKKLTNYTAYGGFVRSPALHPLSDRIVYEHWQAKGNIHLVEFR